jgi:hypothetical protein
MSGKTNSSDTLGIEALNVGNDDDEKLGLLLKKAAKEESNVRFLRVANPVEFRKQVIRYVEPDLDSEREDLSKKLFDTRIPKIEFLLSNPFGKPFLQKLDKEGRTNWQIWRIKNQILKFTEGIIHISKKRDSAEKRDIAKKIDGDNSITIGFHLNDLIWNLGILDRADKNKVNKVFLRSYGKGDQKGHDNPVKVLKLTSEKDSLLCESFMNYYESIKSQPDTIWFSDRDDLANFEKESSWPSLFKGNALRLNIEDLDPDEEMGNVAKICINEKSTDAEILFLRLTEDEKKKYKFFKLPEIISYQEDMPWRGKALEMEKIEGYSLFELFNRFHAIYKEIDQRKSEKILGQLIYHSLKALQDFRNICENELEDQLIRLRCDVYPYSNKLVSALEEVKPYLGSLSGLDWDELIEESKKLGKNLEKRSYVPFRDAQLKNRIIRCSSEKNDIADVVNDLMDIEEDSELYKNIEDYGFKIYDVDFESSYHKVTAWDDIIHILLFENIGLNPMDNENLDVIKMMEKWTGEDLGDSKEILWQTLLLRSVREFCRRLWYANVMPNTYKRRYGDERYDYYLNIALFAREKARSYIQVKKFLNLCKIQEDNLWKNIKDYKNEGKTGYLTPELPEESKNLNHSKINLEEMFGNDNFTMSPDRSIKGNKNNNITSINIMGSNVQIGLNQTQNIDKIDLESVKNTLNSIKNSLEKYEKTENYDLNPKDRNKIDEKIRTLNSEVNSDNPDKKTINEGLSSLRNILEGCTGSILATFLLMGPLKPF